MLALRKLFRPPAKEPGFVAVGYPKVGNTWLRLTLGRYAQQLAKLPEPPLFETADDDVLRRALGPQAAGYFTHAPLTWDGQVSGDLSVENVVMPFAKQRVVLLVRSPLDTLASFHKQQQFRAKTNVYEGGLIPFLNDPVFGLEKMARFYRLWLEGKHLTQGILVWRYEDARRDPIQSLRNVLQFLNVPIVDAFLADAAAFASFENMKAMEVSKAPKYRASGLSIFATGDRDNPDAFHVRNGKVGGYLDELPSEDADRFESMVAQKFPAFYGYRGRELLSDIPV